MKNTKQIIALFATLSFSVSCAYASTTGTGSESATLTGTSIIANSTGAQVTPVTSVKVDGIDFLDEKTMSLKLSQMLPGISADSEVKVLEDFAVLKSTKDPKNAKKVKVELSADMVDNLSYSLVSVADGLDASMDFTLAGDKSKIMNPDFSKDETSIQYISVVDPKTIEITFNKNLTSPTVDFKMFKELKVENTFLDTTNLNVKMSDALTSKKDYIAILSLKDMQNKDIEVENSLYDFTTPEFATPQVAPIANGEAPMALSNTGTTTASGELAGTASGQNVDNVAMDAKKTPDTGTQTNVLLFLTFILSIAIFAKRKSLKA